MTVGNNLYPSVLTSFSSRLVVCLLIVWGVLFLPVKRGKTQADLAGEVLSTGASFSATLGAGETKTYLLDVQAHQHCRLEVNRRDFALKVEACADAGPTCVEFTRRDYGLLDISFTAPAANRYRILITSLEKDTAKREFEIRVREMVTATERHKSVDVATMSSSQAETLKENHDPSFRLAAISTYEEARRAWELAGEPGKAAEALCNAGDVYYSLSQYRDALGRYEEALTVGKDDELVRLRALNGIGYMYAWLGENDHALKYAQEAQQAVEGMDGAQTSPSKTRIRAQALNTVGEVYYARRRLRESIEVFEKSLILWKEAQDRGGEALALLNIGYSYGDQGNFRKASDYYSRSLQISRLLNNGRAVAFAETALGGASSILGETQSALDAHHEALQYFREIGEKQGQAVALNGIASAYEDLNEYYAAIDNYEAALSLYTALANKRLVALNKFVLGRTLFRINECDKAERSFLESLELSRSIDDQVIEASALQSLSAIYFARGETRLALSHINLALDLFRKLGNDLSQAYALNDRGRLLAASGDANGAVVSFQQALPLMRRTGDQRGEAATLVNLGRVERDRGNLEAAKLLLEDGLAINETLYRTIRNSQLKTSYFSSVQEHYEIYIDVLMQLHQKYPEKGYAALALVANERSRARTLLSSLLENKTVRQNMPSELAAKELELLQDLDDKAENQMYVLSRQHTTEEAKQISEDIRALTIRYYDVRSQLRQQNSHHAILTQTNELRADDLQSVIKDDETILLEFALGDAASYLWVVSRTRITSYKLPGRATIESLVRSVYDLVTVRESIDKFNQENINTARQADVEFWNQAAQLSDMLFGPVAAELGSKRLLIVADGALQHLMFDALPEPGSSSRVATADLEPLFLKHEVISLPSALTFAALGAVQNHPVVSDKIIAVYADPVFDRSDPRIAKASHQSTQDDHNVLLSRALRGFPSSGIAQRFSRLPSTMSEAKSILAATDGEGVVTTGLAATKEQVLNGGVKDYRIIHFATHGLLNSEHPELSGIVLSLMDENGNDRNGFLRINDIYTLDLSADLIVLSACRTGLGKDVRGEGIVGLPTSFMYAGAKSIVASLWKVDDEATAELMGHFYVGIFKEGLPPAAALRKAKEKMWRQERWRAPFYWGAFVFQGQYSNQIEIPSRGRTSKMVVMGGILIFSVVSAHMLVRRFKGRRKGQANVAATAVRHDTDL